MLQFLIILRFFFKRLTTLMQTSRLTFGEIARFLYSNEVSDDTKTIVKKLSQTRKTHSNSKPHRKEYFNTPRSLYRLDYLETESLVYSEMSAEELISHVNKIWVKESNSVRYQYNLMSEFEEKEFIARIQRYLPKNEGGFGKKESTSYIIDKNLPLGLPVHTIKNPYLLFIKLMNNAIFGKLNEFNISRTNTESEDNQNVSSNTSNAIEEKSVEDILLELIGLVKNIVHNKFPIVFKEITAKNYSKPDSFSELPMRTRSQILTKIWNNLRRFIKESFRECCKTIKNKLETDFETMIIKKSGGIDLFGDQDLEKENELEKYISNLISNNKNRYNYSQFLLPKKPMNEFIIFYSVFNKMAKNKDNIDKISLPLLEDHIKNTLEKFKTKKERGLGLGVGKKIKVDIGSNSPKPAHIFKNIFNHIKSVSETWKKMTAQEKRPYKIMAAHEQCKYKESLQTYFLYFMDADTLNEIVNQKKKITFKMPYTLFKESNKVSGEKHSWSTASTKIKLGYITSYLINKRIKVRKHIREQEERDKAERKGIMQSCIELLTREECVEFLDELELNHLKEMFMKSCLDSEQLFELDRVELLKKEFNDVYEIERYTTVLSILKG